MQIYEFHFNPQSRQNKVFDSFCYEPINIEEKRLGNLYIVGEIIHAIFPTSSRFLNELASHIKNNYYQGSNKSPEIALNKSLKKANGFLSQELEKENTSWLGNLNLAILGLSEILPKKKIKGENDYMLNFTKIDNIKILLQRGKKIIDVCSNLTINEIEPYPLRVFSNVLSGELNRYDLIFVLTQELYNVFLKEKIFEIITNPSDLEKKIIDGKFTEYVKKILNQKKENLSKTSGIFLLIDLSKGHNLQKNPLLVIKEKELSFVHAAAKKILPVCFYVFSKIKNLKQTPFKKITLPTLKSLNSKPIKIFPLPKILKKRVNLKLPEPKFPKLSLLNLSKISFPLIFKKNLILILLLFFILSLGFFVCQKEKEKNLNSAKTTILDVEQKINVAQNFLILNKEKEANLTFQEAWQEILPLAKSPNPVLQEASLLKAKIENMLYSLNKSEIVDNPTLFFEFQKKDFSPQNIFSLKESVYILNPLSKNLFEIEKTGKINTISIPQKFNFVACEQDSLLFFQKPNTVILFKDGKFEIPIQIENYAPDSDFSDFATLYFNLYLFNSAKNEIIKYPYLGDSKWDTPTIWSNPETKNPASPLSIALDGSIWILGHNSEIQRYYEGLWKENLKIETFPKLVKPTKIWTSPLTSYLYILEPKNHRILVLTKSGLSTEASVKAGEVMKQFQSEKFDNLSDFAVSNDEKTIWLLNGQKIYQINL